MGASDQWVALLQVMGPAPFMFGCSKHTAPRSPHCVYLVGEKGRTWRLACGPVYRPGLEGARITPNLCCTGPSSAKWRGSHEKVPLSAAGVGSVSDWQPQLLPWVYHHIHMK